MLGPAVDLAFLQFLGHDLPDARVAQAFLGGDFLVGETLAQPCEDPPSPEDHALSAQPPAPGRRLFFNHAPLLTRLSSGKRSE
jgi:hypothetical protein